MDIRETLEALVCFLSRGHQSGNTTAALIGAMGQQAHGEWPAARLVYPTEEWASRVRKHWKVPCISLSDPHGLRVAPAGPVVFDAFTVEVLAIEVLQRIQFLESRLDKAEAERDSLKRRLEILLDRANLTTSPKTIISGEVSPTDAVSALPRHRGDGREDGGL